MEFRRISLLLLTVLFFSCESDLYNPELNKKNIKSVKDLVIPEGFDWNMVTSVTTNVSSTTNTLVSLYVDDSYTEESQIASFVTTSSSSDALPLSLPSYLKKVYLKYEKQNGEVVTQEVPVLDNVISFSLPADSKQEPSTQNVIKRVLTRGDESSSNSAFVSYPGGGWGTLMFEDMFPVLGDYDFNDVVANYKAMLYLETNDNTKVLGLNIGVTIKALGGDNPFDLHLQIKGIKNSELDIRSLYVFPSKDGRTDNVDLVNSNDANSNIMFSFDKLMNNLDKNKGGKYLNTEPSFLTSKLSTVNFIIFFKKSIKLSRLPFNSFDFFIANPDRSVEIHTKGNTSVFSPYNATEGLNATPYTSSKGYVWAINVPYQINNLIEGTNFLLGYPMFAEWAESAGVKGLEWYKDSKSNIMNDKTTGKQIVANPVSKYMIKL